MKTGWISLIGIYLALILVAIMGPHLLSAEPVGNEKVRVQKLLERIEESGLVFIRNGTDHSASSVREHLMMKLSHAGDRVNTAEEFIDLIASKSYLTGIHYKVKYPDGRTVLAKTWLYNRLAEIDLELSKEKSR